MLFPHPQRLATSHPLPGCFPKTLLAYAYEEKFLQKPWQALASG
jgi:hypothetical protein